MTIKTAILALFLIGSALASLLFLVWGALPVQAATVCSEGSCSYVTCQSNADCGTNQFTGGQYCQGSNQVYQNYITYTCNNPGTANSFCSTSITQKYQTSCSASQTCRYGLCMEIAGQGSYSNPPSAPATPPPPANYNYPPYQPSYSAYAVKGCFNNKVYWYDTAGSQTYLYQNCSAAGQTCQNGSCVGAYQPPVQTPVQPPAQQTYVKNFKIGCYQNNVSWYDSSGKLQDLFQNCDDNNQCTVDTCQNAQCVHTLQCDGTTCSTGSPDYQTYCALAQTPDQTDGTAAVSENRLVDFIKKWYPWLIIIAVLIFLFVIIFRKLSEKV